MSATQKLRQAQATIYTQSKYLVDVAQLKTSIHNLIENAAFVEASEKGLKGELSGATAKK